MSESKNQRKKDMMKYSPTRNGLKSELDRFRVAYVHHLQGKVEPISLPAVEEGIELLSEVETLRMKLETCRLRLGGHPDDPTHWPVPFDPMTGMAG